MTNVTEIDDQPAVPLGHQHGVIERVLEPAKPRHPQRVPPLQKALQLRSIAGLGRTNAHVPEGGSRDHRSCSPPTLAEAKKRCPPTSRRTQTTPSQLTAHEPTGPRRTVPGGDPGCRSDGRPSVKIDPREPARRALACNAQAGRRGQGNGSPRMRARVPSD